MLGQLFDRLRVAEQADRDKHNNCQWVCRCTCGNLVTVREHSLTSKHTKSCGCLKREVAAKKSTTHGLSKRPEYKAWDAMRQRCTNPKVAMYPYYGGRGITYCSQWDNFKVFFEDMDPRPAGASLERLDNDGPYAPHNCRWADKFTQGSNMRSNRNLTYCGETRTIAEWSRELSIPYNTIWSRLRLGWTTKEALSGKRF